MKTVHVILGAKMGGQHNSLVVQAMAKGINLSKLKDGEAVLFINSKKDKMKAYSFNRVVSYIRFDDPRRGIDMDSINEIPRAFSSDGTLDYSRALKLSLQEKLKSREYKRLEII